MNKSYKELEAKLESAKIAFNEAKRAIEEYSDGYKYHVILLSYGSRSIYKFKNEFSLRELINEEKVDYENNIYRPII